MAQADHKRTVITLYTEPRDPETHWIRIILEEKGIQANLIAVDRTQPPPELHQVNPYAILPTLIDKRGDLVLYKTHIIAEYLDERFPHPPLLPVYPISRAKNRQMIYRIEQDWYPLLRRIETGKQSEAQKLLRESLEGLSPLFSIRPYFLSDEFTLVDCCISPLLWRLSQLSTPISMSTPAIDRYQERIFTRPAFKASLSEIDNRGS